jgi:hypothetical protein
LVQEITKESTQILGANLGGRTGWWSQGGRKFQKPLLDEVEENQLFFPWITRFFSWFLLTLRFRIFEGEFGKSLAAFSHFFSAKNRPPQGPIYR